MLRALTAILIILALFSACTQRTICPAFQSAYIYDKDELRKKFSYIKEDSTPKIYSASKTKYLIAEPTTYRKKMRQMRTVAVKPVYVTLPDSMRLDGEGLLGEEGMAGEDGVTPGDELDRAARSVIDSVYIEDVPQNAEPPVQDSVYVISKDREVRVLKYDAPDSLVYDESTGRYVAEKPRYAVVHVAFNVQQDNYMWYLRDYLVLPDVKQSRVLQMARAEDQRNEASKKGKKEKKGFFRRLFGKKTEEPPVEEPPVRRAGDEEEFDFIDENQEAVEEEAPQEEKKRKGLFRKRDKKPKPDQPQPEQEPADEEPPAEQDTDERELIPEDSEVEGF